MDSLKLSCGPRTTRSASGLPMVRFSNPRVSITQARPQPSHSSTLWPESASARISSTLVSSFMGSTDTACAISHAIRSPSGTSSPASSGRSMQGFRICSSISRMSLMPSIASSADSNAPERKRRSSTSAFTGAFSRPPNTLRLTARLSVSSTASSMPFPPLSPIVPSVWKNMHAAAADRPAKEGKQTNSLWKSGAKYGILYISPMEQSVLTRRFFPCN